MFQKSQIRKANALVLTTGLLIVIMGMLSVASTRLASIDKLTKIDFAEQQAAAAAEAVTSFRETRLVELAATNDLESLAVNPISGVLGDPYEGIEWFGDCLVRWRVEPALIANDDDKYITNPFLFGVSATLLADPDFVENHEYYHFRILSEAHYLTDPNLVKDKTIAELDAAGELPWQKPSNRTCVVRASRIVQMALNSLFKYALFYAKEGPYGDIEMGPGGTMGIAGRVHSNGSVYMASGSPTSWSSGGGVTIGSSTDYVDLVAIGGVYRMRKDTMLNHRRGINGAHSTFKVDATDPDWGDRVTYGDGNQDPGPNEPGYIVPVGANVEVDDSVFTLNGAAKPIRSFADSRSGAAMQAVHGAYLRDAANTGATVVKTLSNIPQLGGRPFEHQRLFPDGVAIWTTNPADPYDISAWTVLPNDLYLPATYYADPKGDSGTVDMNFLTEAGTHSIAVKLWAKKLYYTEDPRSFKAFRLNQSYQNVPTDLVPQIAVDEDGDGELDGDGAGIMVADIDNWFVDAGGLRQYYQRLAGGNGVHAVDGDNTTDHAKNIVDIFDTYSLYTYNPNPKGTNLGKPDYLAPGDTDFRYNGNYDNEDPANGDSDLDSFGDNEVMGSYLDWAMNGKNDADNAGLYGLVIRERRYQRIPEPGSPDEWVGMPDRPVLAAVGPAEGPEYDAMNAGREGTDPPTPDSNPGYMNMNSNNSNLVFTVDVPAAGTQTVVWTYALDGVGTYSRDVDLWLNGTQYITDLSFTGTTGWTVPGTITTDLPLLAGSNVIEIRTKGNDCGNIDKINVPTAAPPAGATFDPTDYIKYMKSQYVVYFGDNDSGYSPHDVTDLFFDYDSGSATSLDDLTVNEMEFLDRREGAFMQYQFWDQDLATWVGTSAGAENYFEREEYRVSMLTFNMRKTLDFLENTDSGIVRTRTLGETWKAAGAAAVAGTASGDMLNQHFSGMIYAHRTRRSNDYTPWETSLWHPDCHLHWKRTAYANYELPPSGQIPWKDAPSTVWPAPGFDWRTGSGPAMTFQSSIRLKNGQDLSYGTNYVADKSTPLDTSDDYLCRKGLTFVSPNTVYIEGDFNTLKYADSNHATGVGGTTLNRGDTDWATTTGDFANMKHVPVAVFGDFVNLLSNEWDDASQNYATRPNVSSDCYMIVSVIINNVPTHIDGVGYPHYSGGSHNILRYLESWSDDTHHILGSLVCMNIRRYSFSHIGDGGSEDPNKGNSVYSPPNRDFKMNSDLFEKPGQPPFSPYGVTVTRTVSTVDTMIR